MTDLALLDRVTLGNNKLIQAWLQVKSFTDEAEFDKGMEKIKEAVTKLHLLTLELQASGFHGCLYMTNGKKTRQCILEETGFCWVCPSDIPYWRGEWETLGQRTMM